MTDNTAEENRAIEGLVAGVITERELAINIGSNHGVSPGMKFKVEANTPTKITDPNTGELLGNITREKVRVKATEVDEKFSVCRTYKVYRTRGGPLANVGYPRLFEPSRKIPETLRAEDSDYLPDLPEDESFVKKGDRVVMVLEEE